jgi:hypothetical protein
MTSAICFWERQNLTAGRAVCDQMVAGWQTFKLVAALGCSNVSFVCFICLSSPVCNADQTEKSVIFLNH